MSGPRLLDELRRPVAVRRGVDVDAVSLEGDGFDAAVRAEEQVDSVGQFALAGSEGWTR